MGFNSAFKGLKDTQLYTISCVSKCSRKVREVRCIFFLNTFFAISNLRLVLMEDLLMALMKTGVTDSVWCLGYRLDDGVKLPVEISPPPRLDWL